MRSTVKRNKKVECSSKIHQTKQSTYASGFMPSSDTKTRTRNYTSIFTYNIDGFTSFVCNEFSLCLLFTRIYEDNHICAIDFAPGAKGFLQRPFIGATGVIGCLTVLHVALCNCIIVRTVSCPTEVSSCTLVKMCHYLC